MRLKIVLALLLVIFTHSLSIPVLAKEDGKVALDITALSPESNSTLGLKEKLYIRIGYECNQPVRFRIMALLNGELSKVGAKTDLPPLHPAGSGEALAWLSFDNTTHIDTLRVIANSADWQPLTQKDFPVDLRWQQSVVDTTRQTPDWVTALTRKQKLKAEYIYDPEPIEKETVIDLIFFICLVSIPLYLYIQVQMLRRYEGRWKELAAIPLISLMPLILVSIAGIGMEFRLWIIFIFRGTPFALTYLVLLWLIKRLRSSPAPKPGKV
ncbi:MAG: hypothetical protein JRE63_09690 [Deltaproteobacteria bacterium]|jgi:hypothetical protein|nr:hypothetical protein [Deltaproteobacteria bacterium]